MKRIDFENGTVTGNIIGAALPMLVAQILNLLYNIVDRIYIARIPEVGTAALGAVGLCFPLIVIISAFANLFGSGGAPLFSIFRGKKEEQQAIHIMNTSFSMLCFSAVILMVIGLTFAHPLLTLFGASKAALTYAVPYMMIYLIGTLPSMIAVGMNPFINAQGYSVIGMSSVAIGAVANLLLDPLFIFVFDMGIRGAAVATVIYQFVSAVFVLLFFNVRRTLFRLVFADMRLNGTLVRKIVSLGTSGFIMAVTNSFVQIICNVTLKAYGGDLYIGVMTILNSVREIANIAIVGITSGAQPVLGFNYGAGEYKRVKQAILFTSLIGFLYTTTVWAIVMLEPGVFIRMFSDSPAMEAPGREALRYYFYGFFFMSFQFAGQSTFVALGKSKQAVFFSLLRKVIIVVPLTILLPRLWNLGVDGVYLAEPISNAIGGLACFITMLCVVWRELSEKQNVTIENNL